jgi:hypothetical protein
MKEVTEQIGMAVLEQKQLVVQYGVVFMTLQQQQMIL